MTTEAKLAQVGDAARNAEPVAFVDGALVHWRVTERDTRRDPGAHGDRCLIFACAEAVRRVWVYPTGWRDLPADALATLSWQR